MSAENRFYENIVMVEFQAFDKRMQEFFFDVTHEQATTHIFKSICYTAVILNITEYKIETARSIYGFKKKLTDEELFKVKNNN